MIVNGNVFVLLSELNDVVPNVKLLELTAVPPTFTVTFDVLNVDEELFNPVSSEPTRFSAYVFPDVDHVPPLTLSAHVGAVVSGVNEYVFAELVFPAVSTNAPALTVIDIVPPV